MADAVLLFAAAVLVMAGGAAVALVIRSGRRRNAQIRRDAPRRLRADLRATDGWIARIDGVLSEGDLDSLEQQRNEGT